MLETESVTESVVTFPSGDAQLWGILSLPPSDVACAPIGVVIVVGGPQYRVGSHRQFVSLARAMAMKGFPTLRFDNRGMGDSEGASCDFQSSGPDIEAAFDSICANCPQVNRVAVWGLCDAASSALMFATSDARVVGIAAANPYVRSEMSLAAVHVKHYYAVRLVQRDFWLKLFRGELNILASINSLIGNLRTAFGRKNLATDDGGSFQSRMARGLAAYRGHLLVILSGNDLTAKEFVQYTDSATEWHGLLTKPKVKRVDVPGADHTFSLRVWQDMVEAETVDWLKSLAATSTLQEQQMGGNS